MASPISFYTAPRSTHKVRAATPPDAVYTLNDLIWQALGTANVPAVGEPLSHVRSDGKRSNRLTQIPWQAIANV